MKRRLLLVVSSSLTLCGALHAQGTRMFGPTSGLIHDVSSGSLRRIMGVPGSAHLGAALAEGVSTASVAPNGRASLLWGAEGGRLLQFSDDGSFTQTPLADVAAPVRVVWSRDGGVAILQQEAGGMQRLTFSNGEPALDRFGHADLPAPSAVVLAVDTTGENVIAALRESDAPGLYRLRSDGAARLLTSVVEAAVVFTDGGELLVIDGAGRRLVRFDRDLNEIETIPAPELRACSRAALVPGGQTLVAVSAETKSVQFVHTRTGEMLKQIELETEPSTLEPLSGSRPIFMLGRPTAAGTPAWILDAGPEPAVWFVPTGEVQQ